MQLVPQLDRWLDDIHAYRRIGLDTNVVIYILEEIAVYNDLAQHLRVLMERGFALGLVSTVVLAEVLVKPMRQQDQVVLDKAELFFRESPYVVIRSFDRAIARRTAQVWASTHLSLPDAMIVETALEERCDALVGNDATMAKRTIGIPYLYMDSYMS